jgi:hypothetical protein
LFFFLFSYIQNKYPVHVRVFPYLPIQKMIETRLRDERFESVKGEYVIQKLQVCRVYLRWSCVVVLGKMCDPTFMMILLQSIKKSEVEGKKCHTWTMMDWETYNFEELISSRIKKGEGRGLKVSC